MKAILLSLALLGLGTVAEAQQDGPVPESEWRRLTKNETDTLMLGTSNKTPELKHWWHQIDNHVCVAKLFLTLTPDNRFRAKASSGSKFSTSVEWGELPEKFRTLAELQAKRQKASGTRTTRDLGTHTLVFRPDVVQYNEFPSDDYVLPEQFKQYSIRLPDPITLKGDGTDAWRLTQRSLSGGNKAKIVEEPLDRSNAVLMRQVLADAKSKGKIKQIPQYNFHGLKDVRLYVAKNNENLPKNNEKLNEAAGGDRNANREQIAQQIQGTKAGDVRADNGLKLELCWCPPGSFTMGSPKNEVERGKNEDQVLIQLKDGFWLGRFEVTQGEWQSMMGTTPAQQQARPGSKGYLTGSGPRHPMYFVSHDEATAFCVILTQQEHRAGRLPQDWEYRLPTEAQWEYACRAGSTAATAFGDSLDSRQANFNGNSPYGRASKGPYLKRTTDVGSYKPNDWGLYDMHGNVWEWCADQINEKGPEGLGDTPVGQASEDSGLAIRGGCSDSTGKGCRSAASQLFLAGDRAGSLGFRVALCSVSN